MRIVCPHCTTSYSVDAAAVGTGRIVRCAKCKEQWLARPGDQTVLVAEPAMAEAAAPSTAMSVIERTEPAMAPEVQPPEPPVIDSPSIASDMPDEPVHAPDDKEIIATSPPRRDKRQPRKAARDAKPRLLNATALCAAMGALVVALVMWRGDVVRLLPQTATFYKAIGLQVNLRGMAFKDIKVATETVDGKAMLLIEGLVVSQSKTPLELPRLRFAVRDAQGQEIYAWNAILDQAVLQPGDKAAFRSRLAAPPPEGRHIDVRFFSKRDLAAAGGKA